MDKTTANDLKFVDKILNNLPQYGATTIDNGQ
jgi:hypothetical protein